MCFLIATDLRSIRRAYNPETQMVPILAIASKALNATFASETSSTEEVSFADPLAITSHHHRQ